MKLVHGKGSVAAGRDAAVWRDVHLSVAHFSLQLCDDPFEVKLRDNYQLREDEYRESVKRKRMLDAKIDELRQTHPLLTQVFKPFFLPLIPQIAREQTYSYQVEFLVD